MFFDTGLIGKIPKALKRKDVYLELARKTAIKYSKQ